MCQTARKWFRNGRKDGTVSSSDAGEEVRFLPQASHLLLIRRSKQRYSPMHAACCTGPGGGGGIG
jgi:hypothetical protein